MPVDRLNPRHGPEVWYNDALAREVEEAYAEALGVSPHELRWYLMSCRVPDGDCRSCVAVRGGCRLVWYGRTGVLGFIRWALHRAARGDAPSLYATRARTRSAVADEDGTGNERASLWVGDVARDARMVCGDDLFVELWDRLRDRAAGGSVTRKDRT